MKLTSIIATTRLLRIRYEYLVDTGEIDPRVFGLLEYLQANYPATEANYPASQANYPATEANYPASQANYPQAEREQEKEIVCATDRRN